MQRAHLPLFVRFATLLVVFGLFAACANQPKKYRKKRECDCPKWNLRQPPTGSQVHAILHSPGGTAVPVPQGLVQGNPKASRS